LAATISAVSAAVGADDDLLHAEHAAVDPAEHAAVDSAEYTGDPVDAVDPIHAVDPVHTVECAVNPVVGASVQL
jgi:hypothetical protein